MEGKMDATKLAQYIIKKCFRDNAPISNLQWQKILYFIQVEFLKNFNCICFHDEIEVWKALFKNYIEANARRCKIERYTARKNKKHMRVQSLTQRKNNLVIITSSHRVIHINGNTGEWMTTVFRKPQLLGIYF